MLKSAGEGFIGRYTRWVIRHRWWVLSLGLAATIAAASGMSGLRLATDYRVFFSEDNPDLAAFDAVEDIIPRTTTSYSSSGPMRGKCSPLASWALFAR